MLQQEEATLQSPLLDEEVVSNVADVEGSSSGNLPPSPPSPNGDTPLAAANTTSVHPTEHLPQVQNLSWTDDFFDDVSAAVAVFDLSKSASITPPTLWSSMKLLFLYDWHLLHLALTQTSILLVYERNILFQKSLFSCCHSGASCLHYEYIPFETIDDVILSETGGMVTLRVNNSDKGDGHYHSKRLVQGLLAPEVFDHALLALQEDFYRKRRR